VFEGIEPLDEADDLPYEDSPGRQSSSTPWKVIDQDGDDDEDLPTPTMKQKKEDVDMDEG
jgi:hypothetical protein